MSAEVTPRAIVDFRMGRPPEWVGLPVEGGDALREWAVTAAEEVTTTEPARQRAASQLHDWAVELRRDNPAVAAVWVPDPEAGDVAAVMRIVLVVDDGPLTLQRYRDVIEPDQRHGVEVLGQREITEIDVPAGPTLCVKERVARGRLFRDVEEHVIYTVFPPDSDEALDVAFSTPYLSLAPQLIEDAELMVSSLRVEVGSRVEP